MNLDVRECSYSKAQTTQHTNAIRRSHHITKIAAKFKIPDKRGEMTKFRTRRVRCTTPYPEQKSSIHLQTRGRACVCTGTHTLQLPERKRFRACSQKAQARRALPHGPVPVVVVLLLRLRPLRARDFTPKVGVSWSQEGKKKTYPCANSTIPVRKLDYFAPFFSLFLPTPVRSLRSVRTADPCVLSALYGI